MELFVEPHISASHITSRLACKMFSNILYYACKFGFLVHVLSHSELQTLIAISNASSFYIVIFFTYMA